MEPRPSFDPEDVYDFFKDTWARGRQAEDEKMREDAEGRETEAGVVREGAAESSKKHRTTANPKALKVTCELLRLFVLEAIQRAGIMAEIEGLTEIDYSHLRRIVSALLHDF